ncbi:MAG: hypothetical protein NZ700_09720 [Gemmataceae bacterium]|nr:hypothetical protein [Gemmataceae bacterium]MDW8266899.1 hypothetical protein [Gemmataceae bacterium]
MGRQSRGENRWPWLALMIMGCVAPETPLVPDRPFDGPGRTFLPRRSHFAPATTEAAARVDTIGRQIIAANPQTGVRPLFRTIGAPQPELFHQGTSEILITEGLVRLCKTDAELAALLCHELGRMISEREALAGPKTRVPDQPAPFDLRIGNDNGGIQRPADQTDLAERWKLEKSRPRLAPNAPPPPPPDPERLARDYLVKAGYAESELDAVKPLLAAAAANHAFEKQLTTPAPPWMRP